jgi:hypothetical protein
MFLEVKKIKLMKSGTDISAVVYIVLPALGPISLEA